LRSAGTLPGTVVFVDTGYELVDHTADIAVRAWAPSAAGVFEECAKAMFSLICDPLTIEQTETEQVRVDAPDGELLLVAWLNELIYRFEASRALFADFEVLEVGERHLVARVSGELLDPRRHAVCGGVKAATLHQLSLRPVAAGWEAFVVLDV
jgi:SHS2 domain-containing protein